VNAEAIKTSTLRAYVDLTRLQFGFAWPLLFSSGLFLAFMQVGAIDWTLLAKALLMGFLGFEAGMVLNDYVDRNLDMRDEDDGLTNYWRLFRSRPLASGAIPANRALALFMILVALTAVVAATLPWPHSGYVLAIMAYSYTVEAFYQVHKRTQKYPLAQLLGRTDFALFPVAGYLVLGNLDLIALGYFLFFYPFAEAHLGANDIIDVVNDKARGLRSVTVLYGQEGTVRWILLFTILHVVLGIVFAYLVGWYVMIGFVVGFLLLTKANMAIGRDPTPATALKVLPFFHLTMIIYSISLIAFATATIYLG
jgi:4-hydroxybenzoate polyprenyltransferase